MKLLWNVHWSHWNDYDTSKAHADIFFVGQIYSSVILFIITMAFTLLAEVFHYIYIKKNCIYIHLLKKKLENWSSTPLDWEIHEFKNKLLICLLRALWSVIIRWSVGSGHCFQTFSFLNHAQTLRVSKQVKCTAQSNTSTSFQTFSFLNHAQTLRVSKQVKCTAQSNMKLVAMFSKWC